MSRVSGPARPPPAVRHRQGGRRQDDRRRRVGPAGRPAGKRVLVCEVDAKGDVTSLFSTPTDFTPREIAPGIWSMSMDTEAWVREYLKLHLPHPGRRPDRAAGQGLRLRGHRCAGRAEILTVGESATRCVSATTTSSWSTRPASGHIVGQLAAPKPSTTWSKVGLIRSQTDWMLDILSDPRQTGLVAVCTPEEMPVNETLELGRVRYAETTVRMSAVVVDRVLPELFGQHGGGDLRAVATDPEAEHALSDTGRWRRGAGARGGAPGGDAAPDPLDAPPAAPRGVPDGDSRAAACRICSRAASAPAPPPGGPRPGRGARAVAARSRRRPRRSASCWPPRTS